MYAAPSDQLTDVDKRTNNRLIVMRFQEVILIAFCYTFTPPHTSPSYIQAPLRNSLIATLINLTLLFNGTQENRCITDYILLAAGIYPNANSLYNNWQYHVWNDTCYMNSIFITYCSTHTLRTIIRPCKISNPRVLVLKCSYCFEIWRMAHWRRLNFRAIG